jgi:serine/threonine protein kinase
MISAPPQIPGLAEWRPLATGGFSTVWQARQESLNRLVAVKVDDRKLTTESERRRFLREAGAAGRMSGHHGIVTVHDAGILEDNRPYLVMELCPGGSLSKWLKPEERKSQDRVREVGVRIADALAAAHARGVLHRDVKPANILIDAYDNPGLADFGLAIIPEPGSELSETLEALTPAYAPREVIYGEASTEASDVYSLAATLYALLAGKAPRWPEGQSPSLLEVIELLDKPIERLPGVDRDFMDSLLRALSDEPAVRPTAAEFRDELTTLDLPGSIHGQPSARVNGSRTAGLRTSTRGSRPPTAADEDSVKSIRRRVLPAAIAAALLVILLASAVAALNLQPDEGAQAQQPPVSTPTATVATPAPTETPTATPTPSRTRTPTATPKRLAAPAGFTDCSSAFEQRNSFCITEPECWLSTNSMGDTPVVGTMADCDQSHVYQTFAAGQLPGFILTQSEFEANGQVRRLCTEQTLNAVLPSGSYRKDWQIIPLPEQPHFKDSLFRCLVSFAEERNYPIDFKVLR